MAYAEPGSLSGSLLLGPLFTNLPGIIDPAPRCAKLDKCKDKHDKKEDPGQSRSVAHLKVFESTGIDMQRVEPGGIGRAACGRHKGRRKDTQRTDDAQH